jgi:hypothetical protein
MPGWMLPEVIIGVVLLWLVLGRVSRHGGQVLHALKHASEEHSIAFLDGSARARKADQHRPAMS